MSAADLLDRLLGTRSTGPRRWIANCPAHEDRTPSLSIRALDDGRVLVHCFAGCAVHDVVASIGFKLDALFPPRALDHRVPPERVPFPAADVLAATASEALIVAVVAGRVRDGIPVTQKLAERAALAAGRLLAASDLVTPDNYRARARRSARQIAGRLSE